MISDEFTFYVRLICIERFGVVKPVLHSFPWSIGVDEISVVESTLKDVRLWIENLDICADEGLWPYQLNLDDGYLVSGFLDYPGDLQHLYGAVAHRTGLVELDGRGTSDMKYSLGRPRALLPPLAAACRSGKVGRHPFAKKK